MEMITDQCCGCGYCCMKSRCPISWFVYGDDGDQDCQGRTVLVLSC
jgi:hypothetical protein